MLLHEALRVTVIGPGRLGQTLVASLRQAGIAVAAVVPSPGVAPDPAADPPLLLVVRRRGAGRCRLDHRARRRHRGRRPRRRRGARRPAAPLERPVAAIHSSGLGSLDLLAPLRGVTAGILSLHPLQSFAAPWRRRDAARRAHGGDGRYGGRPGVRTLARRPARLPSVRAGRRGQTALPPGRRGGQQPLRRTPERGGRADGGGGGPRARRRRPPARPARGYDRRQRRRATDRHRRSPVPSPAATSAPCEPTSSCWPDSRRATPTPIARSRCRRSTWPRRGSTTRPCARCATCSSAPRDGCERGSRHLGNDPGNAHARQARSRRRRSRRRRHDHPHDRRDARGNRRLAPPARSRADHGRAARRPPGPRCGRRPGVRRGGRVDLREPDPVRTRRGPRPLPARRGARRGPGERRRRDALLRAGGRRDVPRRRRHHRARRRAPRRPLRGRGAPGPLRRRRDDRDQAAHDRRPRPCLLRAQGRPAARRRAAPRGRSRPAGRDRAGRDGARARRPGHELAQRLPHAGRARQGARALPRPAGRPRAGRRRGARRRERGHGAPGDRLSRASRGGRRPRRRAAAGLLGRLRRRSRPRQLHPASTRPPAVPPESLIVVAARLGATRLLDNVAVGAATPDGAIPHEPDPHDGPASRPKE